MAVGGSRGSTGSTSMNNQDKYDVLMTSLREAIEEELDPESTKAGAYTRPLVCST
jgi:hypothetical protein